MKVVVIGGGISGLATAFGVQRLARERGRPLELTLLESAPRLGGTISTVERDGFRCEYGPNGFLDSKPSTLELVEHLGLTDQLLRSDDAAAHRFLLLGGRLIELPTSPGQFLTSPMLSVGGRLRVIWERFVRRGGHPEETVAAFARRRLGKQACARLIDPFVTGIFAGNVEELELASAFPRLVELETEYGSLIKASGALKKARKANPDSNQAATTGPGGRLTSFAGGLDVLIDGLAGALGTAVRMGVSVEKVQRDGDRWRVEAAGETLTDVDRVVLATPAYVSARLLAATVPSVVEPLEAIGYAPANVAALGFRREDLGHALDGFGFLIPTEEGRRILGCLWTSSIFPGHRAPEGHVLVRVMVGGARRPELAALADDELVALVQDELRAVLDLKGPPVFTHVSRHGRAIPQYGVGHGARRAALDGVLAEQPGLYVTGNALRGVGINDCTREAARVAEEVVG